MRILVSLLVVVFTLAVPGWSAAQGFFGFKGGLTRSNVAVSGDDSVDTDAGNTGTAGVVAGVQLNARTRMQAELLFGQRRFTSAAPPPDVVVRSRSVEIPLLFVVHGPADRRVRPMIYAGPQVNVISNVRQTVDGVESDLSDRIKNTDFGITFGGGIEIGAPRGAFPIEVRANIGLQNLNEDEGPTFKSRAIHLLVGYRF